jgi:DNA polymerase III epsilon subunit-like protein
MKYVSIDIETTGLDPESCQILQIGAVIEDTNYPVSLEELPKFQCIVEHDRYTGQPTALKMNSWIFEILSKMEGLNKEDRIAYRKQHNILPVNLVARSFAMWLSSNAVYADEGSTVIKINAAGKNFASFDKVFLQKLPSWGSQIQMRQRILDPAILLMDWKNDESLPNLQKCMDRCKIKGEVTHDALQDAIDVVQVLRVVTGNYNFVTWI